MPVHGPRQVVSSVKEPSVEKTVNFRVSHLEKIETLAKQRDQSVDDVIETLIEAHLKELVDGELDG